MNSSTNNTVLVTGTSSNTTNIALVSQFATTTKLTPPPVVFGPQVGWFFKDSLGVASREDIEAARELPENKLPYSSSSAMLPNVHGFENVFRSVKVETGGPWDDKEPADRLTFTLAIDGIGKKERGLLPQLYDHETSTKFYKLFDSPDSFFDHLYEVTADDDDDELFCYPFLVPQGKEQEYGFYEIINNREQKIHFDLDIDPGKLLHKMRLEWHDMDLQSLGLKMLTDLLRGISIALTDLGVPAILEDYLMVFSSCREDKASYHVVLNKLMVSNAAAAKSFYHLAVTAANMWEEDRQFIDASVYSSRQQFRLLGAKKNNSRADGVKSLCSKVGEIDLSIRAYGVDWVDNPDGAQPLSTWRTIFWSSLVSNVISPPCELIDVPYHRVDKEHADLPDGAAAAAGKLMEDLHQKGELLSYSFKEIDGAYIVLENLFKSGKVPKLAPTDPDYAKYCCKRHGRIHESLNAHLTVGPGGEIWFNCYCKEPGDKSKPITTDETFPGVKEAREKAEKHQKRKTEASLKRANIPAKDAAAIAVSLVDTKTFKDKQKEVVLTSAQKGQKTKAANQDLATKQQLEMYKKPEVKAVFTANPITQPAFLGMPIQQVVAKTEIQILEEELAAARERAAQQEEQCIKAEKPPGQEALASVGSSMTTMLTLPKTKAQLLREQAAARRVQEEAEIAAADEEEARGVVFTPPPPFPGESSKDYASRLFRLELQKEEAKKERDGQLLTKAVEKVLLERLEEEGKVIPEKKDEKPATRIYGLRVPPMYTKKDISDTFDLDDPYYISEYKLWAQDQIPKKPVVDLKKLDRVFIPNLMRVCRRAESGDGPIFLMRRSEADGLEVTSKQPWSNCQGSYGDATITIRLESTGKPYNYNVFEALKRNHTCLYASRIVCVPYHPEEKPPVHDFKSMPKTRVRKVEGGLQLKPFNIFGGFQASTVHNWTPECEEKIRPILEHIYLVIANGDVHLGNYIVSWFAHLLKNPAKPSGKVLVIIGRPGSGKSLFLAFIGKYVFGHKTYTFQTSFADVSHHFNKHLPGKIMVLIDDAAELTEKTRDVGAAASRTKAILVNDTIPMTGKGENSIQVANVMNLIITTEHDEILRIDDNDRRYVFCRVNDKYATSKYGAASDECERYHGRLMSTYNQEHADLFYTYLRFHVPKQNIVDLLKLPHSEFKERIARNGDPFHTRFLRELFMGGCWPFPVNSVRVKGRVVEVTVDTLYQMFRGWMSHTHPGHSVVHDTAFGVGLGKMIEDTPGFLEATGGRFQIAGVNSKGYMFCLDTQVPESEYTFGGLLQVAIPGQCAGQFMYQTFNERYAM